MSHTYKRHPQTAGRVIDGLAFVITANDNRLHTLNESGTLLWELAQAGTTIETAALALIREFEVDLESARVDVFECLQALVEREILVVVDPVELGRP